MPCWAQWWDMPHAVWAEQQSKHRTVSCERRSSRLLSPTCCRIPDDAADRDSTCGLLVQRVELHLLGLFAGKHLELEKA